ncbi:Catalase-peroxidase [Talaromyces islandicus]|uniref:Catalase-peroxidase n=1 Tax=Talaromyces islandicus TaxID=28573 RepID=A0A0U1LXB2_TALIS|nr:Catalase-peroxidase [Talaromyces islandicus]
MLFLPRWPLLRPFLLSLIVVSSVAAKIVHLLQHIRTLPRSSFFLYLPTFFLLDFLVVVVAWALLQKTLGIGNVVGLTAVAFVAIVDLGAASSQLGFFYVTGAEVRWGAATSVAADSGGLKLLLSGLIPVVAVGAAILALTFLLAPLIYFIFDSWFSAIVNSVLALRSGYSDGESGGRYLPLSNNEPKQPKSRKSIVSYLTVAFFTFVFYLRITRPPVPYNHMSGAIPFTLWEALNPEEKVCQSTEQQPFPIPELVSKELWEPASGRYKGWHPGQMNSTEQSVEDMPQPSWAPQTWPAGFGRWELTSSETIDNSSFAEALAQSKCPGPFSVHNTYDPALDPMRITNLGSDILEPVQKVLSKHKVSIKHVVVFEMESARKDVFPFKAGSHLHQMIVDSYDQTDEKEMDELNAKFAALTPIAEQITGESGNFPKRARESALKKATWKDPSGPDMGGINVVGALTGSSLSFKSFLGSHCGVAPLPVDFMFENRAEIYQPCIMHILDLFNRLKEEKGVKAKANDMRSAKWKSIFMQSITGEFDNQNHLNDQMGFQSTFVKETIDTGHAKHYHEGMKEINYFGYPEVEILPYLKDSIEDAKANGDRLFLSHFTSTTHHPWGVPGGFPTENYWSADRLINKHEDSNKYLNAVRYVDSWLGTVMQVLEDTGIAKETLVVFVGDHGQAFKEDSHITGTFENGHISNFRIPLVFRHPMLPRIDVEANATSISILPTILDLLINTDSLNADDKDAASDLIHEYEGQSLIRPYKKTHNGREAWNIGIINTGGTMLSVASAAVPYRIILPLTKEHTFVFSDLSKDPDEIDAIEDWDVDSLSHRIEQKYGVDAANWAAQAIDVGHWWVGEKKRIWNFRE